LDFWKNEVHEIRGHSAHGLNASNKGKDKETYNGHGRGMERQQKRVRAGVREMNPENEKGGNHSKKWRPAMPSTPRN
jgi:hypothetical protein